jgi:hypothetical protein
MKKRRPARSGAAPPEKDRFDMDYLAHLAGAAKNAAAVPPVEFTVVTNNAGPLTKTFKVGEDGAPVSSGSISLWNGIAEREILDEGALRERVERFATILSELQPREAIICAPPPPGKDQWPVVTRKNAEDRGDVVARAKEHFAPVAGPALMMLDFDVKDYPSHIRGKLADTNFSAVLASVFPAFGHAASVLRPSSSVGIRNRETGQETPRQAGQHRYYFVQDGTDIAEFVKRLEEHLILNGWGWGKVSEAGVLLYRTLIDVDASCDTSRLCYEADAILADPRLEHVPARRAPVVKAGGFLDTRALPPLTGQQHEELARIKEEIASAAKAACEAARAQWRKKRRAELIARGVKGDVADRVLRFAVERRVLEGDFRIELDDNTTVTVREILADPGSFHKKTCADPLEPEYGGGRNKAVIYADCKPVRIYSHAHGGIDYRLLCLASDFFEIVDEPSAEESAPSGWSEPIDVFGDGDQRALTDVAPGALPTIIDRYARDVAERMGVPVIYAAMGALVTVSAAVGGGIRIQPKARDTGWKQGPFLWAVIVEEPGGKKTPLLEEVVAPLRELDDRRAKEDVPRRNEWELRSKRQRAKDAVPPGPRPKLRRSVVDGFTVEALRDILVDNSKGVLVSADEITGLISGLDQYKAGGGSDRADLLKLMDGKPRSFDRVGRSWRIDCWGAAVLGGIQPKKIAQLARSLDPDGLLQRFIPIVGDNVRRPRIDRAPDQVAIDSYTVAAVGLADLPEHMAGQVVTLSPEAQEVRSRFDDRIDALLDLPRTSAAWRGHLNKWPGFFARLLLVFHMLDHWREHGGLAVEVPVSCESAERVWRFAELLLAHAIRFYEDVIGLGASGEAARLAAGIILISGRKLVISRRNLYEAHREWRPGELGAGDLLDAMRVLERHGWCKPFERTSGGPIDKWEINPAVYDRFKERGEAERVRRASERARVDAAVAARRAMMGQKSK